MGLTSDALADKSQRWWHLSSIQLAGGIISVPVISIASQIFTSSGVLNTILSIIVGNLIVLLISYFIVSMSFEKRLNAVENAAQFIGKNGGRVLAFYVLITMIGWVAWELISGEELLLIFPLFSKFSSGSLIGAVAALILLIGIRGLKALCVVSTIPLIILLFAIMSIVETSPKDYVFHSTFSFLDLIAGVSLIISASAAAVVDYPTFFRHSKTKKDSIIALVVIFIVTSIIQSTGIFLFKVFAMDKEVIGKLLSANDINSAFVVSFLIISMVSSTAWNIYAASVGWESLFPIFKDRTEYAVIGLAAIVLISSIHVKNVFVATATFSDTIISGLGGVLIFEFINRKRRKVRFSIWDDKKRFFYSNASWFVGALLGVMAYINFIAPKSDSTVISLIAGFVIALSINKIKDCTED